MKSVLDKEKFPLLDNELPDISFDRLDYFLRDGISLDLLTLETARMFLDNFQCDNNILFFTDPGIAAQYAILFMNMSRLMWIDPDSHGSYFFLAEILKKALTKGIITEKDFFRPDNEVMNMLSAGGDQEIASRLAELEGLKFEYASKEDADYYGKNKPRTVDPWVKVEDRLE